MHHLITGGAGFIGLHLARALLCAAGPEDRITLVDTLRRHGRDADLDAVLSDRRVGLIEANLTTATALEALPKGVDRVYHLAAVVGVDATMQRPADVIRTNTLSTIHVVDWASEGGLAENGRLIFSSTSETYSFGLELEGGLPLPTPETVPLVVTDPSHPRSAYTASKILGETYVLQTARQRGLLAAVVRFHNVYGSRMGVSHVIPQVMERLHRGESPLRRFGREQTRAFCHVDDAVRATTALMECDSFDRAGIVHIGDATAETSIADLYDAIMETVGRRPALIDEEAPSKSPARRLPDTSKLEALTGFAPRVTLKEGLRDTWQWYRKLFEDGPATGVFDSTDTETPIPLAVPVISEKDVDNVVRTLRSGWVSAAGPEVGALESEVAAVLDVDAARCVALVSGTAALFLAYRGAGIGRGELVISPDLTFAGSVNPVYSLGALPALVDVNCATWGLDAEAVERFLSRSCRREPAGVIHTRTGRRVKALVAVHMLGHPCGLAALRDLASRWELALVEDAAEALGTLTPAGPTGSLGDWAALSFNGNKIVTGGSGGILVAPTVQAAQKMRHLATTARTGLPEDPTEWVHDVPAHNLRMSSLTASLIRSQLADLKTRVEAKRAIAQRYDALFREASIPGITFHKETDGGRSNHWLSAVLVNEAEFGITRRELLRYLKGRRIETRPVFAPLSMQPAFQDAIREEAPRARAIWRSALCLPSSPDLEPEDQIRVVGAVREAASLVPA